MVSYCQGNDPVSFTLPDTVFFRVNKYVVDSTEYKKIESVANYMKEHRAVNLEIISFNSPRTLLAISLPRACAKSVAKMLIEVYGIDEYRIVRPRPVMVSEGGMALKNMRYLEL